MDAERGLLRQPSPASLFLMYDWDEGSEEAEDLRFPQVVVGPVVVGTQVDVGDLAGAAAGAVGEATDLPPRRIRR